MPFDLDKLRASLPKAKVKSVKFDGGTYYVRTLRADYMTVLHDWSEVGQEIARLRKEIDEGPESGGQVNGSGGEQQVARLMTEFAKLSARMVQGSLCDENGELACPDTSDALEVLQEQPFEFLKDMSAAAAAKVQDDYSGNSVADQT